MKKITLRFSSLVLACVPFLIAGSSIVQANDSVNNTAEETIQKNTADTTSDTTSSSKTEITKEIEKNETTPLPLTTKTIETTITNKGNDGVVFGNGTLTVAKYKEIELKGQFTPKKYNTIEIDKDGNWKALKAGTESITVEFTPDETTLALLKESYPDDNFNTPFKSEAIEVTVTSAEEVTPSSTTDSIETETVSVPLKLTESTLKTTEGTLAVQTTDGQKVTGEFTTIDKAEFTLKTDGTYTIPEAAQEKDLKETVTFTLNQASIDSLAKNEAYKDKNIETKYELEVTKKAQKKYCVNHQK